MGQPRPGPNFTHQNDRNQKQGRCQWEDSEVQSVDAGSASLDEPGSRAVQAAPQSMNLCHHDRSYRLVRPREANTRPF